jgi:hypothetical protein
MTDIKRPLSTFPEAAICFWMDLERLETNDEV